MTSPPSGRGTCAFTIVLGYPVLEYPVEVAAGNVVVDPSGALYVVTQYGPHNHYAVLQSIPPAAGQTAFGSYLDGQYIGYGSVFRLIPP